VTWIVPAIAGRCHDNRRCHSRIDRNDLTDRDDCFWWLGLGKRAGTAFTQPLRKSSSQLRDISRNPLRLIAF
jgi:hypothetical protein